MAPFARMKAALLASLRGNIIVYQGEELGLEQDDDSVRTAERPRSHRQLAADPVARWRAHADALADEALGGFTSGEPWLPLSPANLARAVAAQEGQPRSLLHFTRAVLALRKGNAALRHGGLEHIAADGAVLSFERVWRGERIRCLFNLSGEANATPSLPGHEVLLAVNGADATTLPAWSALLARV
jgi:alpha-glucosidase